MRARDRSENDGQNAAREILDCGKARIITASKIKASEICSLSQSTRLAPDSDEIDVIQP